MARIMVDLRTRLIRGSRRGWGVVRRGRKRGIRGRNLVMGNFNCFKGFIEGTIKDSRVRGFRSRFRLHMTRDGGHGTIREGSLTFNWFRCLIRDILQDSCGFSVTKGIPYTVSLGDVPLSIQHIKTRPRHTFSFPSIT